MKIASGGMATVYAGRLRGKHGFSRVVAMKRAHAHLLEDEQLRRSLLAEARLASRIHHPNVVSVLDVDEPGDELVLVMDYVEGASLSQMITTAQKQSAAGREPAVETDPLRPAVIVRIVLDVCAGLHAAHELADDEGAPLGIVHRDVSPQNILVGVDGLARLADFGIAKCSESTTATAGLRGKFGYMAPEYISDRRLDRRVDIFALGVVLWEALTKKRLFRGEGELETIKQVMDHEPAAVSTQSPAVPKELDHVVARALAKDPDDRYPTALELANDLAAAAKAAKLDATSADVSKSVLGLFGPTLEGRRIVLRDLMSTSVTKTTSRGGTPAAPPAQELETLPGSAPGNTDALTLPVERPVASASLPLIEDDPEATHGPLTSSAPEAGLPSTPKPRRSFALLGGAIVAGTAALTVVTVMRGSLFHGRDAGVPPRTADVATETSASPLPNAPEAKPRDAESTGETRALAPPTSPSVAADQAPLLSSASGRITAHHFPGPATRPPSHPQPASASAPSTPTLPQSSTATIPEPAKPVPAATTAPPATSQGRPGLGY